MNEIIILVLLLIPTILILVFWRSQLINEKKEDVNSAKIAILTEKNKITLPLRITAYERLIVMMERFKPTGLVMRTNKGGMNSFQMQLELLSAVRKEFEHNISMQMYVSDISWELVCKAKEETSDIVKKAASIHGANESVVKLNTEIINLEKRGHNKIINLAISNLKKEVRQLI